MASSDLPTTLEGLRTWARDDLTVVRERMGTLGSRSLNWKPGPDQWSVGQCLQHLNVTDEAYIERMEKAFDEAPETAADGDAELRGSWFGRWFTRMSGPVVKRAIRTPGPLRPSESRVPTGVVDAYVALHRRLMELLDTAPRRDLERLKIASPVSSFLRFRISDALRLLVVHDRRHVRQALRVMEADGFPSGDGADGVDGGGPAVGR